MLKILGALFSVLCVIVLIAGVGLMYGYYHYARDLPDYRQLAKYDPPTVTRVHAGDGRLLAEFSLEKRVYVPIQAIPQRVINAFLAAEDKNFYSHPGVDFRSVLRAVVTNIINIGRGRRPVGASTITQQVAKNFLLTNEVSVERKIKEAILAFRIEQAFSKHRILELYLNEIFLGFRSYGVAAAALNYFNKSLDSLTIAEAAYLAALPKGPNNYHPLRNHDAAVIRRNWVIGRMVKEGLITEAEATAALAEPLQVVERDPTEVAEADYFAEEVRRELVRLYGEEKLYQGGLSVRTTLDPRLQTSADMALRKGLIAYDRRHGWRGPVAKLKLEAADWVSQLAEVEAPKGALASWTLAVVLGVKGDRAEIGLIDGGQGLLPMTELTWARPPLDDQKVGPAPKSPGQVLEVGDVVMVEPVAKGPKGQDYPEGSYGLRQVPAINGAIVAIDPHTGRVLAMSGGFSFKASVFNRATQAARQPGSAFKPLVYLAALEQGLTPSTIVLDAPFVADQGEGRGKWKPGNYTKKFYGPTPMRIGIEKSRNLMTIRLAQTIGMEMVAETAERMEVVDYLPRVLSMSLGAGETTLLRLTTAYAMLVNGGHRIKPSLIDRVQDGQGRSVFRHDERDCLTCRADLWLDQPVPELADERERIADPASAYQIVSMLQGVVERGTGVRIKAVGKPLAGKTGTTNDSLDTWFVGFSPDLAVGVFAGFDEPKTLGPKETGSSVAAPIFRDFMAAALKSQPAIPFRIPTGIRLVRVNGDTGRLAKPGDRKVVLEAFKPGSEPSGEQVVIDGGYNPWTGSSSGSEGGPALTGDSGLY
ncbi:MAG: penicillin-binding protein 1A [Kiloniellales bacterium]|nr:penicillin-binding protein 1A [Kiloniellales bacterium]